MDKELINPPGLVRPRGFTHGILVTGGRLLFLAGQDATGADGQIVAPGDLVAQFAQALSNLTTVVEAAGGGAEHVVKLTIYVKSRDDYVANLKPLGEVYRRYFGSHYPAMALFEVSGFFQPDALVEIEGIAVLDEE
ncbi:MAG TPA: RidA family protein [Ktedonobacterales bacterium]|jgi:enamine deaminase RidA (YjgF/YER057c/UK114 family)